MKERKGTVYFIDVSNLKLEDGKKETSCIHPLAKFHFAQLTYGRSSPLSLSLSLPSLLPRAIFASSISRASTPKISDKEVTYFTGHYASLHA